MIFSILDALAGITPGRAAPEGLLLVRLDAIGDFIIWLDSAKEFRRLYPDKCITLCANSTWALLAEKLPYWDQVWPIDVAQFGRNPIYRFITLQKIRKAGFEVAIQPTVSRVFLHGDAIIRASGAIQRIGSVGDLSNMSPRHKRVSDGWYTALVAASEVPLMELERNAEFIRNLSCQEFKASLPALPQLTQLPSRLKISTPYFIIFPGASWSGRQWPAAYFVEVVVQLHRKYHWTPVLCGGPSDAHLCQAIVDQSATPAVNLGGVTSLPELVELLRGACILIGNETSAIHLAAATSTPAVCILGGGHFGRFMPYPEYVSGIKPAVAMHKMPCYYCNWRCTQAH